MLCFCSNWVRTVVSMTTYSFHRLIMGKVEINIFVSTEIFIFLQKCLLSSPIHFIKLLYEFN